MKMTFHKIAIDIRRQVAAKFQRFVESQEIVVTDVPVIHRKQAMHSTVYCAPSEKFVGGEGPVWYCCFRYVNCGVGFMQLPATHLLAVHMECN